MYTKEYIVSQLRELGIKSGDMVNAKVSLKSIGKIDGGPNTLIAAIMEVIGEEGTLVCESFNPVVSAYLRFFKKKNVVSRYSKSYAGAFVNAVVNYDGSYRSTHPIQAFSAIGKYAKQLTEGFTKTSRPYGFLQDMADLGAKNLRIGNNVVGVGTTHIAILEMGFEQKDLPCGVYYTDENGKVRFFRHTWASGCPKAYKMLEPYYDERGGVLSKGNIGEAAALVTDMKKTLEIEMKLFKDNPDLVFCGDPACISCSFNWRHSKHSFSDCVKANIQKKNYKHLLYAILVKFFGRWHKI